MEFETERLIIRKMTENDFDGLKYYLSDKETMSFYKEPFDDTKVKRWLDFSLSNYKTYGFGWYALVLKETGKIIGDCGLSMQIINHRIKPELGYHIHKDYWRKGLGKEASKVIIDWYFKETPFNELYSYMEKENVASWSLAVANGMKKVDEYQDNDGSTLVVYVITRKEWESKH